MSSEQTLSLIKPDGVARGLIGEVIGRLEKRGLKIKALKMVQLSKAQALNFYQVHKERPFYQSLTTFMSSGPIVAMILEGDQAVQVYRELMGATDYRQAAPAPSGPTLPGRSRPISSTAPTARRARPAKSPSSSTPWSWFSIGFREYFDLLRFWNQQALQFFRLIDNFLADQPHLSVHYVVEDPGLPFMFSTIHLGSQGLRGIARLNGHRQREKYRAAVIDRIDKMHGDRAVDNFPAVISCHNRFVNIVSVIFRPAKSRQRTRMDINRPRRVKACH